MNKNFVSLSSISMDLERVAMGYQRGSLRMADRFLQEAIKRKKEVDLTIVKPYIKNLLNNLDNMKREKDKQKLAEDALMYSVLFQNAAIKGKI